MGPRAVPRRRTLALVIAAGERSRCAQCRGVGLWLPSRSGRAGAECGVYHARVELGPGAGLAGAGYRVCDACVVRGGRVRVELGLERSRGRRRRELERLEDDVDAPLETLPEGDVHAVSAGEEDPFRATAPPLAVHGGDVYVASLDLDRALACDSGCTADPAVSAVISRFRWTGRLAATARTSAIVHQLQWDRVDAIITGDYDEAQSCDAIARAAPGAVWRCAEVDRRAMQLLTLEGRLKRERATRRSAAQTRIARERQAAPGRPRGPAQGGARAVREEAGGLPEAIHEAVRAVAPDQDDRAANGRRQVVRAREGYVQERPVLRAQGDNRAASAREMEVERERLFTLPIVGGKTIRPQKFPVF